MKKAFLKIIAIICFLLAGPFLIMAQEGASAVLTNTESRRDPSSPLVRIPAYRVFCSGIPAVFANNVMAAVNVAVRGYFREFVRDNSGMEIVKNEEDWVTWLINQGLFNTKTEPRPREWDQIDLVVYLEKGSSKDTFKISIISLNNGEYLRTPLLSAKPHDVAKSIALLMAEEVTDPTRKRTLQKAINSYFLNSWNFRTIDLCYNGIVYASGEPQTFPISGGIGLTFPLSNSLGFMINFSGIYFNKETMDLSAGMGFIIQKVARFSPEFSIMGGYSGNFYQKNYDGGPFFEPGIGFGFHLFENMKISVTGSFRLAYFPAPKEFSTRAFGGVVLSFGF